MTSTNAFRLAASLMALAFAGTIGTTYAAPPAGQQRAATVVYQDASTPDCDKTPEDPRCKDKKK